jgi:uncharacterized protein YecE (DUF72 family)
MPNARAYIGTSGYQYDHWKGVLYPEDLPKDRWFETYAEHFDAVEINNTFYHLPEAETFTEWGERAPDGFVYTLKYSRYGTHIKRLKDPQQHVDVFLERAKLLGDSMGPILVQLPSKWRADPERLEGFLSAAPSEHRWALEFRDPRWLCQEVYEVLEKHRAALVIHDLIQEHPQRVTGDWVYLRMHGQGETGQYTHQKLAGMAQRIAQWLDEGLDVHAYFNNDPHGYAVEDALNLKRYLQRRGAEVGR